MDVSEAPDRLPTVELHGLLVQRPPMRCVPVPARGCPTPECPPSGADES
jgi:hypothetical protein